MDNKVLALVNGVEITENDLNLALAKFPQERRSQFSTEEGQKQLLEQVISWELLYNHAKDNNFEAREEYKMQIEDARKGIMTQLAVNDILSKVKVSDAEIAEYYDSKKDTFMEEPQVKASHILVDSEDKAKEVIKEIKDGLEFKEAAKKYSSCPSKEQGGSLGAFGRGMMVPEFEEAAFDLELGKISEPVKTQFGYHIIIVEEKLPRRQKSLEEVKAQIMNALLQARQTSEYMSLIETLKGKYNLEIK